MHISLGLTASVREVGFCFGEGEPMPLFGENFVIIDYDGVAFHITIHAGIYETIPANAESEALDSGKTSVGGVGSARTDEEATELLFT